MSAVISALSNGDSGNYPDPNLNVETVFKEPEPEKDFLHGGILPFLVKHKKSILKLFIVILYYVVGCIYYNANMEWDTLDCIYFITVSITTVGYGDYSPDNNSGRMFTCFYVLIGIVVVFGTINDFAQNMIARAEAHALEKLDDDPTDDKVRDAITSKILWISIYKPRFIMYRLLTLKRLPSVSWLSLCVFSLVLSFSTTTRMIFRLMRPSTGMHIALLLRSIVTLAI